MRVRWAAWAAYALAWTLVYALALPGLYLVPLVVWFAVALFVAVFGHVRALRPAELRLFAVSAALFPLWEFALKWASLQPGLSAWHTPLNRLEHLLFMSSTVILLYPLFRRAWRVLLPPTRLVLFVGLASFVGNTVEFYEYGVRLAVTTGALPRSYADTIWDMAMNVIGALLAYALVRHAANTRLRPPPR